MAGEGIRRDNRPSGKKIPEGRIDGDEPKPVSFRTESYRSGTRFPLKVQPWGELLYALSGVCEIEVDGKRFLSPPSYGIWIPPGIPHEAWSREDMVYVTTYVAPDLCRSLPKTVRTLALSTLLKAILGDFSDRGVTLPTTPADRRLALVLVDQIGLAPQFDSYLPFAEDRLLAGIVDAFHADPGERRSLAEWARQIGVTERTLSRRWLSGFGISFNEWRLRLKLVRALSMLDGGAKVQEVARTLGYSDASAFIAMFRRMTGTSPSALHRKGGRSRGDGFSTVPEGERNS